MWSERPGTPTHGRLDRDKAKQILQSIEGVDEYNWPERLGPYLDALEACVVPDPRITRIEALLDESHFPAGPVQIGVDKWVPAKWLRAILDGNE